MRWGLIGPGRAGSARLEALRADGRVEIVGINRGHPEALAALLADADAVAICSPDATHPGLVSQAIGAGCHVICEYPLAPSRAQAEVLLAQAATAGRVLHVGHIELGTPAARWIRAYVATQGPAPLMSGVMRFRGPPRPGCMAMGNLARLHRLVDAVGMPLSVKVHAHEPDAAEPHLIAELRMAGGGRVDLELWWAPDARRRFEMVLELRHGTVMQVDRHVFLDGEAVGLSADPGLFAADTAEALGRMRDGMRPSVPMDRVLDVLGLAEDLGKG
jgi:predicted dehydrogenase